MENLKLDSLRKKANALPELPGVYIMKSSDGTVIYVGKAKALKRRVTQYFRIQQSTHTEKVRKMVENVNDFDYILTDSEFEALVLECSLIKQYNPKYNILLKDDKGYHYIRVTKGEYPTISAVKQILDDGAEYIGPYTSSFTVTSAVDEVLKIFRLPQCSKSFPNDISKKRRPCLNFYIKQCAGVCAGHVSKADYNEAVEGALQFLKNGNTLLSVMNEQMMRAAENLEFEKAAKLRDRINAIKKISQKQKVVSVKQPFQDVFALFSSSEGACFEVFRFNGGRLCDKESFILESDESADSVRDELLTQYYSIRDTVPPVIAIDGQLENKELLEQWLTKKRGGKVRITVPERGEQAQLVKMCMANAAESLAQSMGRKGRELSALQELAGLLGLENTPKYIESYDISHTAGSENVGAMVVFENGRPLKSAYKKFEIKTVVGQDDYASMQEVLDRRFSHYDEQKDTGEGFGRLPDLILMDGGAGQVNAVIPVLEKYGLKVPIFGMVKDSSHRTRAIAYNGGEISISSQRESFTLVSSIQDEVHRFAIGYHRQKRKKNLFVSNLMEIEGVGEKRAKNLFIHFKTMKNIKEAGLKELEAVSGINAYVAKNIYSYFHESSENDKSERDKI